MLVAALSGARGHFGARWASRVPGASLALLVALLAYAALSTPSSVAAPSKGPIIVAHLEGEVDPLTAEYVHRALSAATDRHASLLVLTIDTPGGLDSSMRQMVQDILNSPVPTVAYVSPPGARAASAGVFVAEASNVVAMAPGTNIGAAHPVQCGGENIPADLRDKITNDAAAYIAGITRQRGRNDAWVQDAVRQSVSLDSDQAVAQHVADLLEPNLSDLLRDVNGRTVTTGLGTVTIDVADALVTQVAMEVIYRIPRKCFVPA